MTHIMRERGEGKQKRRVRRAGGRRKGGITKEKD